MSTSVAAPTSQGANTGAPSTGSSADAYLRLADIDDATYVTFENGELITQLGFGTPSPSIPSEAVVKSIVPLIRASCPAGGVARMQTTMLAVGGEVADAATAISTTTVQQIYPVAFNGDYDPAGVQLSLKQTVASDLKITTALLLITWVDQPVVTITAPIGTLTDETRPTVTWENTLDADGGGQFSAAVRIWTDAVYSDPGFDPETSDYVDGEGIFGTDTTWQGEASLVDGDYHVGVKISQPVSGFDSLVESEWDFQAFSVAADRPAAPDLTVTPDDDAARNAVIVEDNTGDATTDYWEVQRSDDGGVTFDWIRTSMEIDGRIDNDGGAGGSLDFEAPNAVTVIYRARAVHEYTNGVASSEWEEVTVESWSSETIWLKHPTKPSESRAITLRGFQSQSRAARRSVKQVMGRPDPVVIKDKHAWEAGDMTVALASDADKEAIKALADAPCALLLQFPPSMHEPDRWIELGDEQISRLIDRGRVRLADRDAAYDWLAVTRPTTGVLVIFGLYPADDLYPSDDLFPE